MMNGGIAILDTKTGEIIKGKSDYREDFKYSSTIEPTD